MLRIRQTEDLDLIQELDRQCFPDDKVVSGDYLENGIWWVVLADTSADGSSEPEAIAYAGLYVHQPAYDPNTGVKTQAAKAFLSRAGVCDGFRGKGLQKRLVRARVNYARRLDVPRVYTYVSTANIASMKTLVRCGFEPYHYMFDDIVQGGFIYLEKTFKEPAHVQVVAQQAQASDHPLGGEALPHQVFPIR